MTVKSPPDGKEIRCRVEQLWDYDWILYHEYTDDTTMNIHTGKFFDLIKTKEQYWHAYQFLEWKLVSFSIHNAEWLTVDDDLTLVENELWWTRWKDWKNEVIYRPLKNMSYPNIKAILKDEEEGRLRVHPRILAYFKSIKIIDNEEIQRKKSWGDNK